VDLAAYPAATLFARLGFERSPVPEHGCQLVALEIARGGAARSPARRGLPGASFDGRGRAAFLSFWLRHAADWLRHARELLHSVARGRHLRQITLAWLPIRCRYAQFEGNISAPSAWPKVSGRGLGTCCWPHAGADAPAQPSQCWLLWTSGRPPTLCRFGFAKRAVRGHAEAAMRDGHGAP